jgi:hypothetical protein
MIVIPQEIVTHERYFHDTGRLDSISRYVEGYLQGSLRTKPRQPRGAAVYFFCVYFSPETVTAGVIVQE